MEILRYKDYDCSLQYKQFIKGQNTCIQLVAADTQHNRDQDVFPGEPIATATVNIEGIPTDHVAVKDYAENQGMLEALTRANIVRPLITYREQGYVRIPICPLTDKALAYIKETSSE